MKMTSILVMITILQNDASLIKNVSTRNSGKETD
jgi:hypothetical protein